MQTKVITYLSWQNASFFSDDVTSYPLSAELRSPDSTLLTSDPDSAPELGMCVSMDPSAGFRWKTRHCSGNVKSAFVCQVPGEDNCDNFLYSIDLKLNMKHNFWTFFNHKFLQMKKKPFSQIKCLKYETFPQTLDL